MLSAGADVCDDDVPSTLIALSATVTGTLTVTTACVPDATPSDPLVCALVVMMTGDTVVYYAAQSTSALVIYERGHVSAGEILKFGIWMTLVGWVAIVLVALPYWSLVGEPLMGRVLVDADEQPSAPPVAVIGYGVWRTRLNGDPNVLGRDVQLGSQHVTVVGVMREGFEFPVSHDVWLPLKTAGLEVSW